MQQQVLELPPSLVARSEVKPLFKQQGLPASFPGQRLVLLCATTGDISETAVDALVEEALARGAAEIALIDAYGKLILYVSEAAERRGAPDRVRVRRAVTVCV